MLFQRIFIGYFLVGGVACDFSGQVSTCDLCYCTVAFDRITLFHHGQDFYTVRVVLLCTFYLCMAVRRGCFLCS